MKYSYGAARGCFPSINSRDTDLSCLVLQIQECIFKLLMSYCLPSWPPELPTALCRHVPAVVVSSYTTLPIRSRLPTHANFQPCTMLNLHTAATRPGCLILVLSPISWQPWQAFCKVARRNMCRFELCECMGMALKISRARLLVEPKLPRGHGLAATWTT